MRAVWNRNSPKWYKVPQIQWTEVAAEKSAEEKQIDWEVGSHAQCFEELWGRRREESRRIPKFPLSSLCLLCLALVAFINNINRKEGKGEIINPVPLMWLMFLVSILQFLLFAISVIFQLSTYLKINVFTIVAHLPSSPLTLEGRTRRDSDAAGQPFLFRSKFIDSRRSHSNENGSDHIWKRKCSWLKHESGWKVWAEKDKYEWFEWVIIPAFQFLCSRYFSQSVPCWGHLLILAK